MEHAAGDGIGEADAAEEEEGSSVTRELLLQGVYAVDGIGKKAVKYEESGTVRRGMDGAPHALALSSIPRRHNQRQTNQQHFHVCT